MDEDERQAGQAALAFLVMRIEAVRRFRDATKPQPTSTWLADQALPMAMDGQSMTNLSLSAAHFYLLGVASLMQGGLDPLSPFALLRNAGEAAARAWWLLDPAVKGETRRNRGLTERLFSLQQQSKAAAGDSDHRRFVQQRLQHLLNSAKRESIQVRPDKNGVPLNFGSPRPDATDLFEKMATIFAPKASRGLGELTYRYMSGLTHSQAWTLLNGAASEPADDPNLAFATIALNMETLISCIVLTVAMYEAAHERFARLAGALDEWRDVTRRLPMPPSIAS